MLEWGLELLLAVELLPVSYCRSSRNDTDSLQAPCHIQFLMLAVLVLDEAHVIYNPKSQNLTAVH